MPFLLNEKVSLHQLVGIKAMRKCHSRIDMASLASSLLKLIRSCYEASGASSAMAGSVLAVTCPTSMAPLLEIDGPYLIRQARERLLRVMRLPAEARQQDAAKRLAADSDKVAAAIEDWMSRPADGEDFELEEEEYGLQDESSAAAPQPAVTWTTPVTRETRSAAVDESQLLENLVTEEPAITADMVSAQLFREAVALVPLVVTSVETLLEFLQFADVLRNPDSELACAMSHAMQTLVRERPAISCRALLESLLATAAASEWGSTASIVTLLSQVRCAYSLIIAHVRALFVRRRC
jgi:hypothetical protein